MPDIKSLLTDAKAEIETLRHRNEILAAKVEVMDLFEMMLRTSPCYPTQGCGRDVVFDLECELHKLKTGAPPQDSHETSHTVEISGTASHEMSHTVDISRLYPGTRKPEET